ncbi:hypothetical protein ACVILH_004307 [Bradyrhizobium sp. USDA 4353]
MAEFRLPKNSALREGKSWPKPKSVTLREFRIYRLARTEVSVTLMEFLMSPLLQFGWRPFGSWERTTRRVARESDCQILSTLWHYRLLIRRPFLLRSSAGGVGFNRSAGSTPRPAASAASTSIEAALRRLSTMLI